jgi:hypothetical protein
MFSDRSMMKAARQGLFRGDDLRGVRLCDLSMIEIDRSACGPDAFNGILITSKEGKKNQASFWSPPPTTLPQHNFNSCIFLYDPRPVNIRHEFLKYYVVVVVIMLTC